MVFLRWKGIKSKKIVQSVLQLELTTLVILVKTCYWCSQKIPKKIVKYDRKR